MLGDLAATIIPKQVIVMLIVSMAVHEDTNLIQFKFNLVTGKNIALSKDGQYAHRKDPRNYFDAVVYGSKPLRCACEFEVEIVSYQEKVWSWSIHIGVMQCKTDSGGITQTIITKRSEDSDNHCMWFHNEVRNNLGDDVIIVGKEKPFSTNLCDLQRGGRVGFLLTQSGDLAFCINGVNQGIAARKLYRSGYDLYPVVDVCCSCTGVKITKAGKCLCVCNSFTYDLVYIGNMCILVTSE